MDYVPANMRMAAARMNSYNRQRFRLETVSSDTAGPNRIVTVNLPENATLSMKSFKLHADVLTTSVGAGANLVYGRLPADAMSLISRVEVYINGIQVQTGCSEYNSVCRLLKIGRSSRDKDGSIDRALSHGAVSAVDAVEDVSIVWSDWKGFLGECSTEYLDTSLLGQIQIRLTFAGPEVLVPKQTAIGLNANFTSAAARNNAALVSYSVSNIFFTIDSVQVDDMYHSMLRQRLASEEFISLNYKEYYTFELSNITTGSHTTRFSLSSQSIDKLYATFRDSNYQTSGIRGQQMDATFSDNLLGNYFGFRSFDSEAFKEGTLRYQFSINNVAHPQYRAGVRDALFDVAYCNDKVRDSSHGHLVTSMAQFQSGLFNIPLCLNHPGEPISVQSGFDSRGINTMLTLAVTGQVPPVANADAQTTASLSSFLVAETTASLKVGLGKSLAISF